MNTRLTDAHLATVDRRKIIDYLLARSHPAGGAKAAFFGRFGFTAEAWPKLRDAVLDHAGTAPIVSTVDTPFGKKYILDGPPAGPDGRKPRVRAVWFIETGEAAKICDSLSSTGSRAMINELDPVVLTNGLPEHGLQAGDVGWVVMVHAAGAGYEVEFVTLAGDTISVITVPATAVRPVQGKEIAHARRVA